MKIPGPITGQGFFVALRLRIVSTGKRPPGLRELADQPIRLDRIGKPWLRPACLEAAPNCSRVYPLPVEIEQRQFAARLIKTPA